MNSLLRLSRYIGYIFFLLLFCNCQSTQPFEDDLLEIKAQLEVHEALLQSLMNNNLTVTGFHDSDGYYILRFSNGLTVKWEKGSLPIVTIGSNGHWMFNEVDSGINAFDILPTADIEIIDGFWYINGKNTGILAIGANGKDGKDAALLISIVEYDYYWRFSYSDGSQYDVNKEPVKYLVENSIVNSFLDKVEYDCSDYSYSVVSDFSNVETNYRKDWPAPISFKWSNYNESQDKKIIGRSIVVTDNNNYRFLKELTKEDESCLLYNLAPGTPYCVKVLNIFDDASRQVIKSERLIPQGQLRMLRIDGEGVSNYRDLGGWKTSDGYIIKYGKLIRGAEVYRDDTRTIRISETGIQQILDLGVSVEIDFGDQWTYSPLTDYGIEFISDYSYKITSYDKGLKEERIRERYKNCILLIIDRLNKGNTILFHCSAGADRTGTLAAIIEGLLGVSESDISKDYELTSFSLFGSKKRNEDAFVQFISFLKHNYEGKTISQKIFCMATLPLDKGGLGLQKEDIVCLRDLMLYKNSIFE